jgi:hypothetical protein
MDIDPVLSYPEAILREAGSNEYSAQAPADRYPPDKEWTYTCFEKDDRSAYAFYCNAWHNR